MKENTGCLWILIILGVVFPPFGIAMIVLGIIGGLLYGFGLAIKFIVWLLLLPFGAKWKPKELQKPTYWNEDFEVTHLNVTEDKWHTYWRMSIANDKRATTLDIDRDRFAMLKEGDTVIVRICQRPSGAKEYSLLCKKVNDCKGEE